MSNLQDGYVVLFIVIFAIVVALCIEFGSYFLEQRRMKKSRGSYDNDGIWGS